MGEGVAMTARRGAVIGVGSSFRGDDGLGPAVVDLLRARWDLPRADVGPADVGPADGAPADLLEEDGEAARLLAAWEGRPFAVVVDAMRSGADAGTVVRIEVGVDPLPAWTRGQGTHDLGLASAVELAAVLGRLPACLVIFGVEGTTFGDGLALSPDVVGALPEAAAVVAREVERLARPDTVSTGSPNERSGPCASTRSAS